MDSKKPVIAAHARHTTKSSKLEREKQLQNEIEPASLNKITQNITLKKGYDVSITSQTIQGS